MAGRGGEVSNEQARLWHTESTACGVYEPARILEAPEISDSQNLEAINKEQVYKVPAARRWAGGAGAGWPTWQLGWLPPGPA